MKLSIAFICIAITAACGGTDAQEIIPSLRGSFLDVFESSCPATCRSSRYRNHNDDCSHCLENPDCYTFNGALDGSLSGGRCCNMTGLLEGELTRENIEAHCHVDLSPEPEPTCPTECRPRRPGLTHQSGCEVCPDKPDCFHFNGASFGTLSGRHCCNSTALHEAEDGLTEENIQAHCHVPKAEPTPQPEPEDRSGSDSCPTECRPQRPGSAHPSGCEACPGMPTCYRFMGAATGSISGNHCCNSTALHAAQGGLSEANIQAHCSV
eukprot:scaffold7520_cov140-Skeletonema_marinoi.AAC.10